MQKREYHARVCFVPEHMVGMICEERKGILSGFGLLDWVF